MTLHSTETWAGFNFHVFETKYYRTCPQFISSNPHSPTPHHKCFQPSLLDTPSSPNAHWATLLFLFVSNPGGGASVPPLILPTYPPYQYSPYSPTHTYTVPSLLSTHIYLISLTFSLGPDKAATVWWLQKLVYDINATLFQQSMRIINT